MTPGTHYLDTVKMTKAGPVWTGVIKQAPEKTLMAPVHWKRPRLIFTNSMSDLFHEDLPVDWIDAIFAVMGLCWVLDRGHIFQCLTKRSAVMRDYMSDPTTLSRVTHKMKEIGPGLPGENSPPHWPLPNVWLGVSCEDQTRADERVLDLLLTPAAVRFVSAEPLLGPIDFTKVFAIKHNAPINALEPRGCAQHAQGYCFGGCEWRPERGLDWIIPGGESGSDARECDIGWIEDIVAQAAGTKTKVFVKQLGDNPVSKTGLGCMTVHHHFKAPKAGDPDEWPQVLRVREMPAGAARNQREANLLL